MNRQNLVCAIVALFSVSALAMDMSKDQKMMMMHEKMASMHTKAMKCLKSGKSEGDCKSMMMKDCKMGEEKCGKMMSMMDDSMTKMMDEGMADDMQGAKGMKKMNQ